VNVLHLTSGNLYGGVETLLVTLARHQSLAPGMQQEFALCFPGRLSAELEHAGATPLLLGGVRASRPWTVARARRTLAASLRERRPDVVICHGAWSAAVFGPALRREGIPFVFFMHDPAQGRHWIERWARLNPPDAVITNSRFTAGTAPRLFPKLPPSIYYCPVPTRTPEDGERAKVRAELGVAPNQVLILQVARMQALKGQREHLLSLAKLKELPQWVSVLVGGPQRPSEIEYFKGLQLLVADLGIQERVKFLGQRQDVPSLLIAADLYFQPNIGVEAFGIALIEAMLAGLPVVASRLGGPAEFVTSDVGFAVSPGGDLVGPLTQLIQSPALRAQLGHRAKSHAQGLCAPHRQLPALAQLLEQTLRGLGSSSSAEHSVSANRSMDA
jgi:glycosyltransferase involved in cell wall biosynthesis